VVTGARDDGMNWRDEWKVLSAITMVFLAVFCLPLESHRFTGSLLEGLYLLQWYAREHVVFCLLPALFIAGAMAVFIGRESVVRHLGAGARKLTAYGTASVSGAIVAVCSCTVLPLFAGIYRMGAGIGPATAFLYAGPAINVLAIILTIKILGVEIGIARVTGAILFSVVIGLLMNRIFRKRESERLPVKEPVYVEKNPRPFWHNVIYFAVMVGILASAAWGKPDRGNGFWAAVFQGKWIITSILAVALAILLKTWFGISRWKLLIVAVIVVLGALFFWGEPMIAFMLGVVGLVVVLSGDKGEGREWLDQTWIFARQILPLLFVGVLAAGILLGRPGHESLIRSHWIEEAVGGNSLGANLFASVAGAFMYFATLTEIPILQGLMGNGMGKGPALALLLAGPALSFPNMLVIRSVMGTKKTVVYIALVVAMASISGMVYGTLF
jgi:uncharacterized membrane protein YraQ (UPF0718 family)